uniref:Ig-like domain-containing protein n=1 Tax=Echeneis naucrates TaxID=173247 RepID=A0A665TCQ8_ECHNA
EAKSISVTQGDPATLEARFSGTKPLKARWLKLSQNLTCFSLPEPPCILEKPESMNVLPGSKVKVCGTPELVPKWFKDGVELASGRKYKISFSRMISSLNVLSLRDCNSVVGNAGEMECKVSGSPPFTISWYHNGEEIQSGPNYDISFSDNSCMLKVATLKMSNSGVYKCKAVNKAGSSETTASLVVQGK